MARFFLNQARKAARCQRGSTSAARSALTAPAQSRVTGTSRVLHRWHFSPGFSFVFLLTSLSDLVHSTLRVSDFKTVLRNKPAC